MTTPVGKSEADGADAPLRRSWAYPVHVGALLLGGSSAVAALATGHYVLVVVAGACWMLAGVSAMLAKESLVLWRWFRVLDSELSDEDRVTHKRLNAIWTGFVLMASGAAVSAWGAWLLSLPR